MYNYNPFWTQEKVKVKRCPFYLFSIVVGKLYNYVDIYHLTSYTKIELLHAFIYLFNDLFSLVSHNFRVKYKSL